MHTVRASAPPSGTRGRILVVEDDDRTRRLCHVILTEAGFEVAEAKDLPRADETLATETFDVVMSGLRLPDTTAVDILRAVRARDADLPVVLLTDRADLRAAIAAIELGALHYLVKPFSDVVLCAAADDGVRVRVNGRLQRRAFADSDRQASTTDTALVEERIHRALVSLRMDYQPIAQLSSRSVIACEALPRTDGTFPSPTKLLEAAAETDRVNDVGRAVREQVARTLAHAPPAARVFVSVQPRDLFDDQLFDARSPLSIQAGRVTLELKEHASLEDVPDLQSRIDALHRLGYRIAIDDLGAGYAGIEALADLHPDVVKVDMSFTRGIRNQATKQKLVRTMRHLCRDVGAMLVTEGVETTAELAMLKDLGCDVFQGWLFARSMRPFGLPAFTTDPFPLS